MQQAICTLKNVKTDDLRTSLVALLSCCNIIFCCEKKAFCVFSKETHSRDVICLALTDEAKKADAAILCYLVLNGRTSQ